MARLLVLLCLALIGCEKSDETPAPAEATTRKAGQNPPSNPNWDPTPSFWVWGSGFKVAELMPTNGSHELPSYYWLLEDLQNFIPHASISRAEIQGSQCPVIRLPPGAETVLKDDCWSQLRATKSGNPTKVVLFERYIVSGRLQIDFDCPSALLPQYANRLEALRNDLELDHLSVTALASWIDAPGFRALGEVADELVPMFYDLERDEPADVRKGNFHGMVDASTIQWIHKWNPCLTPWRAGLPNFQRLSIFNEDGSLVGHHRKWSIDGLLNHPAIEASPAQPDNIRLYQVVADGTLSGIPIQTQQTLAWRQPDESMTREAIDAARSAGAIGIVWFAHPDSAPKAWHSVAHLTELQQSQPEEPQLTLEINQLGALRLTNAGPIDLLMSHPSDPIRLIVEAPPGSFSHGGPGRFSRKEAPGASLNHPETIRRVELEFAELRSGDSLITGHKFTTLTEPSQLQWSIEPAP